MTLFTGLATAGAHTRLETLFGIPIERQRQIGTFIVLFSMVEQQLEFTLLSEAATRLDGRALPTDTMQVSDRLKALRKLASTVPSLASDIGLAADLADVLMLARHTIVHGVPIASGRLERNRSWLGEDRKRPFSVVLVSQVMLDDAARAADILFKLLASIGAALAGQTDIATFTSPTIDERRTAREAVAAVGKAIAEATGDGNG